MRQGMADARATISGFVEALTDSEQAAAARSTFREKYPDSFWVDFGALRSMHIGKSDYGLCNTEHLQRTCRQKPFCAHTYLTLSAGMV